MTRDYGLSILRVAFIVWIVVFHSLNWYVSMNPFDIHIHPSLEFIMGITIMVLFGFMYISGMLFAKGYFAGKYRDKQRFLAKKSKRLLVPYIFWAVCLVLLYSVSWMDVICGAKHLWFLLCLFDLMVIHVFLMPLIAKTSRFIDFVLLSCYLVFVIVTYFIEIPNLLRLQTAIRYMPAFLVGIYVIKYNLVKCLMEIGRFKFYVLTAVVIAAQVIIIVSPILRFATLYMCVPHCLAILFIYVLIIRNYPPPRPLLRAQAHLCSYLQNNKPLFLQL